MILIMINVQIFYLEDKKMIHNVTKQELMDAISEAVKKLHFYKGIEQNEKIKFIQEATIIIEKIKHIKR